MTTHAFLEFLRRVVDRDTRGVARELDARPEFATTVSLVGATRWNASEFYFARISHYLYAGDTALHMAAAALSRPILDLLHRAGADPRARNRRGAHPLHYASDAGLRDPHAQAGVVQCLISAGADVNAEDGSGVSPLHRAVRARSSGVVRALLEGGADPRKPTGTGSTPLHLAVQDTGARGSGDFAARRNQAEIIGLLLDRGATWEDRDGRGRTAGERALSRQVQVLLRNRGTVG